MLISLRRQLHRLLHQRRGQLLLTLLAALWLALPLSVATPTHAAGTAAVQPTDSHCAHHAQDDIDPHSLAHGSHGGGVHHGDNHHGNHHDCHCAQACHASPAAIVTHGLNLPLPTGTAQPNERPQQLASTLQPPLYRPPIVLAA